MSKYVIVEDFFRHDLEKEVNSYLNAGWKLYGFPGTYQRQENPYYYQALIKLHGDIAVAPGESKTPVSPPAR